MIGPLAVAVPAALGRAMVLFVETVARLHRVT